MIDNYEYLVKNIFELTNIDLNCYKERQMKRRINSLISKYNLNSYKEYIELIKKDKDAFNNLKSYITINVTEFFRNPNQWELLEQTVIPKLLESSTKTLKIWSAACSTGNEPYSIAMLLSKYVDLSNVRIIATDIDEKVLEKARNGIYSDKSIKEVPEEFKTKFFSKHSDGYQISQKIKGCIEFRQHNLLTDTYPSECDLIVCRNVLIYFTEKAKENIYKSFNRALKKDGIFFIGSTEQIIYHNLYGLKPYNTFFYSKEKEV